MYRILLFSLLLLASVSGQAQNGCMLVPISTEQKIQSSPLIVEGRIIAVQSYAEPELRRIYTVNTVQLHTVFKGNAPANTIQVITEGGQVGLNRMTVSSENVFKPGDAGLFFLYPARFGFQHDPASASSSFEVYAAEQGFLRYTEDNEAVAPFIILREGRTGVFELLKRLGLSDPVIVLPQSPTGSAGTTPKQNGGISVQAVPTISGFSPTTINAGTRSILTITGTGFGATKGSGFVEFRNANSPSTVSWVQPNLKDYVSWSDTQIQVRVPSKSLSNGPSAGTGQIRVTNSTTSPNQATSASTLTILYSALNLEFNGNGHFGDVMNDNGSGGYSMSFHTEFAANANATASFNRAFFTWKCETEVNWVVGANSAIDTALNDGTNIVRFDNGNGLPAGVLGRATSSLSGCASPSDTVFYVTDQDIVFDDATVWEFGPSLPSLTEIDFETVALHELGHWHMLDHVINNLAVMHALIATGDAKRVFNTSEITGGNDQAIRFFSLGLGICVSPNTPMTANTVTPPTISISASQTSICSGTSVTFTATTTVPTGTTIAYQWKKNGANVGTNSSTYSDATLTNGAVITCVITQTGECNAVVTSNSITMTVNSSLVPDITISASPGTTICTGTSVTFTATPVNGGTTPSYQWQVNGSNVGTNSATFTTSTLTNGQQVRCILTSNAACASPTKDTSLAITMTVNSTVTPDVTIAASPGTTICSGTSVTFTAAPVNGGTTPSYQWQVNGSNVGTNSATFTTSTLTNGQQVRCILTSNAACASPTKDTSLAITMTVNPIVTTTVSVVVSPNDSICTGNTATFTATVLNGGSSPTYQWKVNGSNVGTNSSTFSTATLVNNDVVTCTITPTADACSNSTSVTSSGITMRVFSPPTVSTTGFNNCHPEIGGYTLSSSGTGILSYQWSTGATTSNILVTQPDLYVLTVTGSGCTASDTARVHIGDFRFTGSLIAGDSIQIGRLSRNGVESGCITQKNCPGVFSISSSYYYDIHRVPNNNSDTVCADILLSGSCTNLWAVAYLNTYSPSAGLCTNYLGDNGTSAELNPRFQVRIPPNDTALILVQMSSSLSTCSAYTLSVDIERNTQITATPDDTICSGQSALLGLQSVANNYSWSNGATTPTITVSTAGTFTVTVGYGNVGCTRSDSQTITVVTNPTVVINGADVICHSNNNTINFSTTASPNVSYSWSTGATTSSISTATSGTFTVTVTDVNGCTATATDTKKIGDYAFNNSIGTSTPVQVGRLNRTGVVSNCGVQKSCPSLAAATGNRSYKTHSVVNHDLTNSACATIFLKSTCTDIFCVAYLNSFNPNSLCTNYMGDIGSFTGGEKLFSIDIPPGDTLVLVVHAVTTGVTCSSYSLHVDVDRPDAVINSSPNDTVCQGNPVTLTAPQAETYNWGGLASTQTYTTTPSTPAANYTVSLTYGNLGCAGSATQVVTVNPLVTPDLTIAASPGSTICAGTSVTFTATPVNGGSTPSYQWQVNGSDVGNNSPTYTTSTLSNGQQVRCILTSNATCASPTKDTSLAITMIVNPVVTPDVTIAANTGSTICAGTSVTFTATPVNGGTTPFYTWQVNGSNVGSNSATFTTGILTNGQQVRCILTSSANCTTTTKDTSLAITMTVNPIVTPDITIVVSPDSIVCAGNNVTFTANAVNGGSTPSYQWQRNGANVGSNSPVYSPGSFSNGEKVRCILTSNATCASTTKDTSTTINMTVNSNVTPVAMLSWNAADTICAGTSVTFSIQALNGGTAPSYQWQINGSNVGNNSPTFTSNTLANGDQVRCILTSNAPCLTTTKDTSYVATMIVVPVVIPDITIAANTGNTICVGTTVTFSSTIVNGGSAPVYQWQINGFTVASTPTYTIGSLNNGDQIRCILTSNATCATPKKDTSQITMTVNLYSWPTVTIAASNGNVSCTGNPVTFTATTANGGTSPSYQWQVNGINAGTNSPTFTTSTLTNGQTVRCIMTSNILCASPSHIDTSNVITMTINPPPAGASDISISRVQGPQCTTVSQTFQSTLTNIYSASTYRWFLNNVQVGSNTASINLTVQNGNSIFCVVTGINNCGATVVDTSNTITITNFSTSAPTLSTISPSSGPTGTLVTLKGTQLWHTSEILFNSISIFAFTVSGDTMVQFVLPAGIGPSGGIRVITDCGYSNMLIFTVTTVSALTLNVEFLIEGFYTGNGNMTALLFDAGLSTNPNACDSITLELRSTSNPSTVVATRQVLLLKNGTCSTTLPSSLLGQSLYLVVRTRNAIETWSKLPVTIANPTNYNFK